MTGNVLGFVIWAIVGCFFIGLGVFALSSKKPVGFWANAKVFEVIDVKKYNGAVAKLFCVYGIVFILLGLPLLSGQNSPLILISVIGVMVETIITMAVYTTVIEKKYKKQQG